MFNNMRGQPIDQKKLRADEDAWLRNMQRGCNDEACIKSRYEARLLELRDQSLKAASPASYSETRPFPAPAALVADVQTLVGTACSYDPDAVGPVIPGFANAPGFHTVISSTGPVVVREKGGTRFAFLVSSQPGGSACEIRDVVVLPSSAVGGAFLQCSVADPCLTDSACGTRRLMGWMGSGR